jgi:hypothetical protein
MGMGFWLFEDIKYDPVSGKNLTRGTWEYKVYNFLKNNHYLF